MAAGALEWVGWEDGIRRGGDESSSLLPRLNGPPPSCAMSREKRHRHPATASLTRVRATPKGRGGWGSEGVLLRIEANGHGTVLCGLEGAELAALPARLRTFLRLANEAVSVSP